MEQFARPVSEVSPIAVSADPTAGQGLALDDKGLIPEAAREVRSGTAALRPSASALPGRLYFATDTKVISYSDGSSWSDDGAINKSIVDAKGDIIAATAADAVSRLAVGANNTVLTADSAQATGLKWAAVSSPTIQVGTETFSSLSNATGYEQTVTFPSAFASTPAVMVCIKSQTQGGTPPTGSYNVVYARSPSTTQVVIGMFNIPNSNTVVVQWLAIVL